MRRLCSAFLAAAAAAAAHAAPPLITEDTGTQGANRWQLEVSGEDAKVRATRQRDERYAGVLSFGLAETADLQVGLPWYSSGADGVGDVSLDLKWRFFERNAWSLGLKPGITLPTGDERDGRGTGRVTSGVLFILSYEPGAIGLHAHVGRRNNRNKLGERESLGQLAGAATYRVSNVRLAAEAVRETNPAPGGRTVHYRTLGAILSVTRDFDAHIGWRTGHGGATLGDTLLFGASVRW